ncbi:MULTISPECIES: DegQ family serine endoprotease [Aquitalea]|uniref:DegQ family serine endoprotease n=1 Tax=Aquitalea TaxID=407217 RepID=UPI00078717DD|nr:MULTISPECIES: DegQ family serine endoprotease [Aquitalea]QBJ80402.1 DegQ family serine endoprotease [Aquitalea sp. USM4]
MSIKKLIVAAMLAASAFTVQPAAALAADLPDFTRIVETEGRAVVNVSTTSTIKQNVSAMPEGMEGDPFFEFFRRFAPQQQQERQERSLGSGFIISPDGYLLTNAHVVARADEITVTLTDKREFKAKVIGSDARTDVALLKIDAKNLPVVRLGNMADVKVGEWVLAIGSPFGFENTVTSGIVSAKNRLLPDENFVPFLQTDAAVNPGNSGGPLFNLKGEVIGINSQIYSRSGGFMGISFSIPIDVAMNVADQLKATGKVSRGRIGVAIQELNKDLAASFGLAKPAGALVNDVEKKSPAEKAGLRTGDIILSVAGQAVDSSSDLPRLIGAIRPGKPVVLEVWRNRAMQKLTVVPEELKTEDARTAQREYRSPQAVPDAQNMKQLGLALQELTPAQLAKVGVKYGLQVKRVGGAAARAGIQPGDVIVGLGGEALGSFAQFKAAVTAAPKGSTLALQLWRQGITLFVPLSIGGEE